MLVVLLSSTSANVSWSQCTECSGYVVYWRSGAGENTSHVVNKSMTTHHILKDSPVSVRVVEYADLLSSVECETHPIILEGTVYMLED